MKKTFLFPHMCIKQGVSNNVLYIVAVLLLFSANKTYSQLPWNEDFGVDPGGCADLGTAPADYVSPNGSWQVTELVSNTAFRNKWYVSATASGAADGACETNCTTNPTATNKSLHIGRAPAPSPPSVDNAARYFESGAAVTATDSRAESPAIDFTGVYNATLSFVYFAGSNPQDYASVEFSIDGGTTWEELTTLTASPGICSPSATWTIFDPFMLPASTNNQPDVRIGFRWRNDGTGNGIFISVAIDDVLLTPGAVPDVPQPDFSVDVSNICEGNCLNFTDNTIFDALSENPQYEWTFNGADTPTSTEVNPTNICYQDPGTYDVTLVVTDNIGVSDPVTMFGFITIQDCGPVIDISASEVNICALEDCINFTDLSTGNNITSWEWTFDGADTPTSTEQNPTGICYSTPGTFDVTLTATDDDGTETVTFPGYITVVDCAGPEINFDVSSPVICVTECVQFTDLSLTESTITSWEWEFPGGTPSTSTEQNPQVCYETPGSFSVTLTATDAEGTQTVEQSSFVAVDPCNGPPQANFEASSTSICAGDCIDFTDLTLGFVDDYLWTFQGTTTLVSTERNPEIICYMEPGTYNVTLVVSNEFGQDAISVQDYITVGDCINPPMPRISLSSDTICAGECVNFSDVSSGLGITSWNWNFNGAVNTSSTEQDPEVCYNSAGTYNVFLEVTGAGGTSDSVFTNVITVIADESCRPTIELSVPDTICAGACANFSADIQNADSVMWTINGGTPDSSAAFNPGLICFTDSGEFVVIVQAFNAAGTTTEIATIFVGSPPLLEAGNNQTINAGATVHLSATVGSGNGDFLWQPYDLVEDFTSPVTTTRPTETTVYIAYYSEEGTCEAVDSVTVTVNFVPAVGVPSAFSPNGDGNNDVLRVLGQGISVMDFRIYNRYGQLVFETDRQNIGWDGTHNGKELNPGVFAYTLEVIFAEGIRETYQGNITLVK